VDTVDSIDLGVIARFVDVNVCGLNSVDQLLEFAHSIRRSRLWAALIRARWVKACGKLPSCSRPKRA
jgi:hypothetical protein